jgi:hypothetical protein
MLPGEWLPPDIPPMGMDDASERFDGNELSLVTEQNFERMFQYDLPFGKDIGSRLPVHGVFRGIRE